MHVEVQNIRCDIPPRKSRHYAEFTDTYRLEIAVIWVFGLYHHRRLRLTTANDLSFLPCALTESIIPPHIDHRSDFFAIGARA